MRCPICACEEVVESRMRGIGKHLLPYSPLTRYRCLNCWYRFWAFRNLPIKIVYLFVFSVLLIGGGIKLYFHIVGAPASKSGPAGVFSSAGKIAAAPEPAAAGEGKRQPPEQVAPPKVDDTGKSPRADEHTASADGHGISLWMRPDPESAIAAVLDREQAYRVIHHDSGWVVLELSDGVVGWARLDDLVAFSPADAKIVREDRQGSSRLPVPVQAASTGPAPEKAAARTPVQAASTGPAAEKAAVQAPVQAAFTGPAPEKAAARAPVQAPSTGPAPEKAAARAPVEAASAPPVAVASAVSGGGARNPSVSEKEAGARPPGGSFDTLVVGVDIGRVRNAPSQDAPIVFRILEKEAVQVVEQQADWVKIRHNSGWSGWAHKSLFLTEKPEAVAAGRGKTAVGPNLQQEAVDRPGAEEKLAAESKAGPPAEPTEKPAPRLTLPESVAAEAASTPERELTVTVARGRVRSAPSLEAPVLFQIEKGQRFSITEQKKDWFELRVGSGPGGWAHASLFRAAKRPAKSGPQPFAENEPTVSPADPGPDGGEKPVRIVEVTVGLVRSAPSATAPVKFRLYGNEAVDALETRGDWIRIRRINGWIGWAHESLFLPTETAGGRFRLDETSAAIATVSVDVGLVREAPSTEAARVCRVVNNMKVEVLAKEKDWLKVRMINGWTGWAHRSLFAVQEAEKGR